MKLIRVSELKIGDVFIDEDTYAVMTEWMRLRVSSGVICAVVQRIVGPTVTGRSMFADNDYLLPLDVEVLLCEEQDEKDRS